MKEEAISNCALLAELRPDELDTVMRDAHQYSVPENHTFFDLGDANGSLYIILSGSVSVERPGTEGDVELGRLGQGATFGEMSFLDDSRTTARVRTAEPTEVLELDASHFHGILNYQPVIAYKLWRNLALEFKRRLALTNDLVDYYADLSQVLRDNPEAHSLLGT